MDDTLKKLVGVKLQTLKNSARTAIDESKLKIGVCSGFMCVFVGGLFFTFLEIFNFLNTIDPIAARVVISKLSYMFYFSVFIMLCISNMIIVLSLFCFSKEIRFLVTKPVPKEVLFQYVWLETLFLSSWAFLFVVGPFVVAYGMYVHAGMIFIMAFFVGYMPLMIIASALGCMAALVFLRYIRPKTIKPLLWIMGVICVGWLYQTYVVVRSSDAIVASNLLVSLGKLIPYFGFVQLPLMPSYWFGNMLYCFQHGLYSDTLLYCGVLASNALLLAMICLRFGSALFYEILYMDKSSCASREYPISRSLLEHVSNILLRPMPQVKALSIKDIKIFLRDPIQWSQFLIFFGILLLYFANLKNFSYNMLGPLMKQFTSICNVSAMMLILASLTVRFIYPQISYEGKRYWMIGIAPFNIKRMFYQKFFLSLFWGVSCSLFLMFLSNRMLEIDVIFQYYSLGAILCMSTSVIALGCSFGIIFPNFKEDNPSRIIAGFGGTLLFIISLFYVVLNIAILIWTFSTYYAYGGTFAHEMLWRFIVGGVSILVIALTMIVVSFRYSFRALSKLEYIF